MAKTPDEQLWDKILIKIEEMKLISKTDTEDLKKKLFNNSLKEEDIVLYLENKMIADRNEKENKK